MQFRSPTGQEIRVALTSGHTAIITSEWRELDEIFHLDALAQGAEVDKVRVSARTVAVKAGPEAMGQQIDHNASYRDALSNMISRTEEGDFTKDHLPNIKVVQALVGFAPKKEDVLRVYREMQDELDTKISDALKQLIVADDENDFTTEGLPTVDAVQTIVGERVSRSQIDPIWDRLQAEAAGTQ